MKHRSKPFAILGIVSIFALGAATGIAGDRMLHHHGGSAAHDAGMREQALSHLHHQLSLDSAQLREVESVLRRHQSAVDQTWNALQPQVHAAIDSVHVRIESLLRPEQREAFRRWVAEQAPSREMHREH